MIVSMFCATATGIWKMASRVNPVNRGIFLPNSSENGPHKAGPKANPYLSSVFAINDGSNKGPTRTNKLVPSRATSSETLNSLAMTKVAVLKTELEKVMQRVMDDKTRV
jgi:hypothetical protein